MTKNPDEGAVTECLVAFDAQERRYPVETKAPSPLSTYMRAACPSKTPPLVVVTCDSLAWFYCHLTLVG